MITHIYTLSDPESDCVRYVGKTVKNPAHRLYQHSSQKDNAHLWNWITKLKRKGLLPKLDVICIMPSDRWADCERIWIAFHRFVGSPLLNRSNGGDGASGVILSQDHRKKISDALKGRIISAEHRRKLSEAMHGKPSGRLGKHHSMEARQRMRDAHLGKPHPSPMKGRHIKPHSIEHRRHLSESCRGKPHRKRGITP